MSQEKVEIARRSMEAYSRGDFDEALSHFHPDISWEAGKDLMPDARTYRGHAGVSEFWDEWGTLFDGFRLEIEECVAAGPDRVLAVTRAYGKGAASGVSVGSPRFSQIFDFEGDLVVRVRLHASRRAAAAALEEG